MKVQSYCTVVNETKKTKNMARWANEMNCKRISLVGRKLKCVVAVGMLILQRSLPGEKS